MLLFKGPFATVSSNAQLLPALTHITSVLTSNRSRHKSSQKKKPVDSECDAFRSADHVSKIIFNLFEDGFLNREALNYVLDSRKSSPHFNVTRRNPWFISHVSAPSFDENKYGSDGETRYGAGDVDASDSKISSFFRNRLKLQSKPETDPDKLKHMLSDETLSKEEQQRVKVAFAEGYTAASGKGKTPGRVRVFYIFRDLLGIVFILIVLSSLLGEISGGPFKRFIIGGGNEVHSEEIDVTFDDVKGVDEAKQELQEVVEFLKNPEKFSALGGKLPKVLHPYANQTINQLLTEMDGFRQNEGVVVLGATNRRDDLDKALLRPGRFDVEVQVPVPDLRGRTEILKLYLGKVKIGKDVDVDVLARRTTGFTGADIENMVNQAALRAAIDGQSNVTMKYLENARDKVLMGPERKSRIPDEEANRITAYHESGHALVAYYTKDANPIHKVTIVSRGPSLGHTAYIPEKETYHVTRAQMEAWMDAAMGGRAAEELVFGSDKVTSGSYSDLKEATNIATRMVKDFGMSEKVGVRTFDEDKNSLIVKNELSDNTAEMIDSEIKRLLQESYERAKNILRAHSKEHKMIAEALLKYETLDLDDVKAVLQGKEPKHAKIKS
ncbi:ATP-dependent zinc metalloprotease YME1-like protein [Dinothrombium tinctorium]|uniref:ATP-dependent zinc metalloprotease YME1-like protein n=1 Tax=Dinothrombium tinctorium TaxID=1965070 RepID=A0A3S3PWK1_9ACAR|nr:ATP-dependent zinc metalloprotease YME1-like protein [Dinothrombium tinctorium]RWS09485.1 ATP-dependent zinc metalloprotease YME1-like protein [Dinothrombium tinctorium]RWS09495.1 ATP-dependent zinc metalloprotease YME1-like protein [Dinothrombium tinctorium]